MLHHARIVVSEADRALGAAHAGAGDDRLQLVVGAVPSAAANLVPSALRDLAPVVGPIQWSLVPAGSAELVDMTMRHEVDCAVVTSAPPGLPATQGLVSRHLRDDEMVVVVADGHHLSDRTIVDFADLRDEVWVEDNPGSETMLRDLATRADVRVHLDHTATDLLSKIGLVAAGHAAALVPGLLVPALRADLHVLRLRETITRGVHLVATREATEGLLVSELGDRLSA